ncbi:MAG: hypothetical protein ABJD07_06475 [Gemmatimonadaceae bacterium]
MRAQSAAAIWVAYDSTSGYSTIELRPMPLGADAVVSLHVIAVFKGRVFATPQYVSLAFIADSGRAPFGARADAVLTAGGTPVFTAPPREIVRVRSPENGRALERAAMRMPTTVIAALARAPSISGRVGGARFEMTPDNRAALREYASRLTSEGYSRALLAAQASVGADGHPGLTVRKDYYEAGDVDTVAAPSVMRPHPKYPTVERDDRVLREFLIEFVVDTTGRARLRSARSTSRGPVEPYLSALRDAMATWEYEPAKKGGRKVAQVLREVVLFDPANRMP